MSNDARSVGSAAGSVLAVALLWLLLVPLSAGAAPRLPAPLSSPASGAPLAGALRVVKGFAPPDSVYGPGHRGVDLAASVGQTVLAAAPGRVSYAGQLAGRGVVVVDHGAVRTTYEPVRAGVVVGTVVSTGQAIGWLTAGAHCGTTPCLHWGLKRGPTYLNPLTLVSAATPRPRTDIRLLPAAAAGLARSRAAERAVVALAEALAGDPAPGADADLGDTRGSHGFALPVNGAITSSFGRRFHPVLKVWKLHDGTDFGTGCGTPIRAPADGVVTRSFFSTAYGHRLLVDHGQVDGRRVTTSYNHATSFSVGVGARVARGQVLGRVGATGLATGCHLHLMVTLDGALVDPMSWF